MFPIHIGVRDMGRDVLALQNDVFRMARHLGNMKTPLTKSVKDVVIPSIAMNFLLGGRPRWRSLSSDRVKARGSARPILIDSRKLLNAAVSMSSWRITEDEASMSRMEAKVAYAKFHQSGTRNMPQREFAILQPKDVDAIVEVFRDWLGTVTAEYGNWQSN